jgi:hypothetical protein
MVARVPAEVRISELPTTTIRSVTAFVDLLGGIYVVCRGIPQWCRIFITAV